LHLDQPQYQPCEINCAVNNEDSKTLVENFNETKIFEKLSSEEDDLELIDEIWYTLFIAEDKLQECPNLKVAIGNEKITSILDTGCEPCLMSQDLYNKTGQLDEKIRTTGTRYEFGECV
jgi:siroheme synthase (precorrin-2 oxidase/ferrochelatase)